MINKIEASKVYISEHAWLTSKFLFSFSEYFDPSNLEWGALRVFNDDTIAPHSGFPMHSHREMEITTIMLSGTLTHKDSMGNEKSISEGYVQRMSTGTGVTHSEYNADTSPVSLYQLWFYPKISGVKPEYVEKKFSFLNEKGVHLLVSPQGENNSLTCNSKVAIYYANLSKDTTHSFDTKKSSHILIYVRSGALTVNEVTLHIGDQARITNEDSVSVKSSHDSQSVIIITN